MDIYSLIEEFEVYLRQLESQGEVVLGCQKCGTPMKQGKKVTEEVMLMWDQIDGDHLYDTKEGYIYTCPNCNSKYNSLTGKWRNSKGK